MTEFQGRPEGRGRRVCLLVSTFNRMVTERLEEEARAELLRCGVREADIDVIRVPGAWELPPAGRRALRVGYDGIVALGCVIRGETAHFDHICRTATDGLALLAREGEAPIALGVLTTENLAQALARAGGERGNQGAAAARAVLEMCELFERLDGAGCNETRGC